jgi:pimeloyl-ACP methyl ester carboxylesterase
LLERAYKPDDAGISKLLGAIRCPALVVRGAGSAIFPRFSAQRMLRQLRRGSLKEVAMAGHGVMVDNPAGFTLALRPFLRDALPRIA